jgi:hypothetical protein
MRIAHVALEFADLASLAAPRLLHHVQLHLAVRFGIGEKCQPAILRPRQPLRQGRRIADALGPAPALNRANL